ncbi:MAG: exosortase/archaeosortase family protein [Armatimonadetes bacterium]|nr:exosortase/archaeosortase family protein [Armatimonadota bacterium]
MSLDAISTGAGQVKPAESENSHEWKRILTSEPAMLAGIALLGILLAFGPFIKRMMDFWFEKDSYYSHGPLIPLISAYVAYCNRDKLRTIPFKPQYWALAPLGVLMYLVWAANVTYQDAGLSFLFIAVLMNTTLIIGGWRWLKGLFLPISYLIFAMPTWGTVIDTYTNPLQSLSSKVAFTILNVLGLRPTMIDTTNIALNNFNFTVGVPCSGLKLVLSVTAFMIFFALIARLRWFYNVLLFITILPLCLFINGLRIAMIGIVGNAFGQATGMAFHDYSGYIALIVCFLILSKLTRAMGWK